MLGISMCTAVSRPLRLPGLVCESSYASMGRTSMSVMYGWQSYLAHCQLDELCGAGAPAVLLLPIGKQAGRQLQGIHRGHQLQQQQNCMQQFHF